MNVIMLFYKMKAFRVGNILSFAIDLKLLYVILKPLFMEHSYVASFAWAILRTIMILSAMILK